ncbi:unnamed protein product [Gongylonema pulchrum]|uniref:Mediator of RNA polymerase II transcription subunit 4 n=1 Tax=Gongylonema pulchrum TaxID=637853 RepID=A0A183ELV3_9BILA|nr:unnamed protein product [Gongylonema pulchrum]
MVAVPEHQKREQEIRRLEGEVQVRDEIIGNLQKNLMTAEAALTKMVFQAGEKLKAVRQAEANRVNSETVIRYANLISRSHSVAAPLTWQLGDPSRPYPTEVRTMFLRNCFFF